MAILCHVAPAVHRLDPSAKMTFFMTVEVLIPGLVPHGLLGRHLIWWVWGLGRFKKPTIQLFWPWGKNHFGTLVSALGSRPAASYVKNFKIVPGTRHKVCPLFRVQPESFKIPEQVKFQILDSLTGQV